MTVASTRRTHTKITGAPDYDDPTYWDAKFATGQDVGEWLNPGDLVLEAALSLLNGRSQIVQNGDDHPHHPQVLHLGPGISKLGTKVRDEFVARGWPGNGIVNVDFSSAAVRLGQENEMKQDHPSRAMHWLQADLLSWNDLSDLSNFAPFDVVLDKSTSDSISTSASRTFTLSSNGPSLCPTVRAVLAQNKSKSGEGNGGREGVTFSPVELLALHLVPLTRKGSTWFALSYSTMRFDNSPYLSAYWEVIDRTPVEAPRGQTATGAHTPAVYHWLYTLQRR